MMYVAQRIERVDGSGSTFRRGWSRCPVTADSLPARRAGLEFVEKLLPTSLTSTDTTERNAGMLRVPHRRIAGRGGYWLWLRVVLVVDIGSPH